MKKKTIGIPRAFLYYRYNIIWENFFTYLGFNVTTSSITTKEILEAGKKFSIDESCLSSKIYIGHINYLQDKCDYILVPRVCDYGKNEKVCVKFNALYDIVKNTFPKLNIISYNIEKTKGYRESISLIKLGIKMTKHPLRVIISYISAYKKNKKHLKQEIIKQEQNICSKKQKILIVSHPYNIYDNYIGRPITELLKKHNFTLIYSDKLDRKKSKRNAKKISPTLYWTYSKEIIGSIDYYKEKIDGIIFLTTFPCGPDSLVNELMIRKITTNPTLNILIDELTSSTGLETRIESFIDIIKERSATNG
ncbi:MAG: hypothetical protein IKF19_01675 [Bacilli bacterium]|nr:hypothetical protein [Bacilli bacterium]